MGAYLKWAVNQINMVFELRMKEMIHVSHRPSQFCNMQLKVAEHSLRAL